MSDIVDDGSETSTLKDLRKQREDAVNEAKALKAQLAALQNQVRTQTVAGVLKDKGVPAKVAKLVPADVEATEEAVVKWLEEFGDVFGAAAPAATTTTGEDAPPKPGVSQEAAAQLRAIQNVEAGGIPDAPVGLQRDLAKIQELGEQNMTLEQFVAQLRQM